MIGFYNYTVYLTYVGLVTALSGLFLAIGGNARAAVICLLAAGMCDMFDGKIARTKKDRTEDEKRFGIQIDSLCDIVCFGVLPAVLGVCIGANRTWQLVVAALFVLCGVIRLAYFNVTEETRQRSTDEKRSKYTGLPITASAIMVPLLMGFADRLGGNLGYAYSALLALLGFCYICPMNVRKPGVWGGAVLLAAGAAVLVLLLK